MINSKRFWFLRNLQAWLVLGMGVATAVVARQPWIATLGVIGYLLVLLIAAGLDPRSLVRMLHAEQENRSLRAEQTRLLGGLKEMQTRITTLESEVQRLAPELQAAHAEIERLKS